jgi:hypothetical protein
MGCTFITEGETQNAKNVLRGGGFLLERCHFEHGKYVRIILRWLLSK